MYLYLRAIGDTCIAGNIKCLVLFKLAVNYNLGVKYLYSSGANNMLLAIFTYNVHLNNNNMLLVIFTYSVNNNSLLVLFTYTIIICC